MDTPKQNTLMHALENGEPFMADAVTQLLRCRRIAIVGNQGSGKTTLAKNLSALLGLTFVNIEWPGDDAPEAEQKALVDSVLERQTWIIDGDFGLLHYAEGVVFFDFPRLLCMWRATKRAFRNLRAWELRSTRVWSRIPHRTIGLLHSLALVYRHPSQHRPRIVTDLGNVSRTAPVIRLTSPKQAAALLRALEEAKRADSQR